MPFCNLVHFRKEDGAVAKQQEKVLIVAPMSGHYATLLRNTVEGMLPTHDVYITDWADARNVPLAAAASSISTTTPTTSSTCCIIWANALMSWRCASLQCRSWPLSR